MKTLFKSIMLIAATAMTFSGCSSDPEVTPDVKPYLLELVAGKTTRTEIGTDNKISWSATGESLKILEDAGTSIAVMDNKEYSLDPTSGKASFTVELTPKTGTSFRYITIHPKNAYVTSSNTDFAAIKFIVPDLQLPTATSFDPDADILVSKMISTDVQPTSALSLQFARLVALGKMQLTNLAVEANEEITDITFSASNKAVTGRGKFNFETDGLLTDQWGYTGQSKESVSLLYENVAATATFDAWFTCIPFSVAEGETFVVNVTTTRGSYTRTVTIPTSGGLNFVLGDLTTFSVNMATAEFTPAVVDSSIFSITFGATHPDVVNNRVDYSPSLDLGVTGSSASTLTFDFPTTSGVIRSTNAFSGYDGASGAFGWWSAANTTMTLNNVNLNGKTNFALTFAAGAGNTTVQVYISKNNSKFFPVSQSAVTVDSKTTGTGLLKTVNFNLSAPITETVSIKFENMSTTGCKLDDIKLMPLDAPAADSYLIDWKAAPGLTTIPDNGGALIFAANNGAGSAPESQKIEYSWEGDECTLAFAKADADTWYTVTNTDNGNGTGSLTIQPEVYTAEDIDRTGTVTISVVKGGTVAITHTVTINQSKLSTGGTKQYTFTIDKDSFKPGSGSGYAAYNGDHTFTAKATDGSTYDVVINTNQIMIQSNLVQFQTDKGTLYNKTDMGIINSVMVSINARTFNVFEGASTEPTTSVTGTSGTYIFSGNTGFLKITGTGSTPKANSITVTFTI